MNQPKTPTGAKQGDRPLPKVVRYVTRGFVFRQFTWRERIKLLIGYNLLLEVHLMSEHNPGQTQPKIEFNLTGKATQASAMLEIRDIVTAEQAAKGVQPNTLPEKEGLK